MGMEATGKGAGGGSVSPHRQWVPGAPGAAGLGQSSQNKPS